MLEPVMTFGGVVITALLATVGAIMVAKINLVGKKVDTAITQTEATGNGFADDTKQTLEEVRESLRNVHRRLDSQNQHTARRDDFLDEVLIRFDGRLTHIEEKL